MAFCFFWFPGLFFQAPSQQASSSLCGVRAVLACSIAESFSWCSDRIHLVYCCNRAFARERVAPCRVPLQRARAVFGEQLGVSCRKGPWLRRLRAWLLWAPYSFRWQPPALVSGVRVFGEASSSSRQAVHVFSGRRSQRRSHFLGGCRDVRGAASALLHAKHPCREHWSWAVVFREVPLPQQISSVPVTRRNKKQRPHVICSLFTRRLLVHF